MRKIIFHVDLDAFFASVEQRDRPALKGLPVIIGADPKAGKGRGVVSTCSYEARAFGIHSAMPVSRAYRLCPSGVYLPPDMGKYQQVSLQVFRVLGEFSPDVEPVSIDEAFLDMTGSCHLFGSPAQAAGLLKARVTEVTGLTVSVGAAPNKMTAKIASDYGKPDGLVEVEEERLFEFLHPLEIRRLWGVGPQTQKILHGLGIETIGDIARCSEGMLRKALGENGARLRALALGIDDREVEPASGAKSVSNEETFEQDTDDQRVIFDTLLCLSEKVSSRMRAQGLKGGAVTLKVRLRGFETHTREARLSERTNHADKIFQKAKGLFIDHFASAGVVRLVGVRVSRFDDGYVRDCLFTDPAAEKAESVHAAVDLICGRFGGGAIRRAGG